MANFRTNTILILKPVFLGFVISTIGVISWSLIGSYVPINWAFPIMLGALWAYLKFYSGSWGRISTKGYRKENFRRTKMSKRTWMLALIAALLIIVIEQSGLAVTFRFMEFPAARFASEYSFLDAAPPWAAWLVIIMISLVAGICEETGFRGYMQAPLEKKFGPASAISIVSLVFALAHLNQAWSGPILVQIFFISVLFGTLAYYSGSLIPGMIAHTIMDLFNFSFWWTNLVSQFAKQTIFNTGIDFHFVFSTLLFLFGIFSFVFVMKKLKVANQSEVDGNAA